MSRSSSGKSTFALTGSNAISILLFIGAHRDALRGPHPSCPRPTAPLLEAHAKRLVPSVPGRGVGPRGTTQLAGASRPPAAHGRRHGLPRSRAGPGCAYWSSVSPWTVRAAARGGWSRGARRRAPTAPGSLWLRGSRDRVPVVACTGHATPHGQPDGARGPSIETDGRRTRIRRRGARAGPGSPGGGKATAEAGEAIAEWLGIRKGRVTLRTGGRSRIKIYLLNGVAEEALRTAIDAL